MANAGMATSGCCCAAPDCTIASDTFDRSDSGTVTGWTEVAGTWAIESNQLRGSAARALIVNDTVHPDGAVGSVRAVVTISPDYTAGDNASRMAVAYHDGDNYLFGEVRLIDGGCLEFQLGQREGGVETWLTEETRMPSAVNDLLKLYLCWQPSYDSSVPLGRLQGYVQDTTNNGTGWPYRIYLEAEADAAGASPDQVALEVTDGETLFNDFDVEYHYDIDDHPDCPTCTTGCAVFGDSFGSSLSSCLWDQVSGSWSTSGGNLVIPATGVLIALRPDPRPDGGIRAEATFDPATTSDKLQVIVDYLDSDNYHFAEIQPGATDGTLKVFKRSGGSNTQLGSTVTAVNFTVDDIATLAVCWDGEVIQATLWIDELINPSAGFDRVTTAHGGKYAGIGASGVSGATASDFVITILDEACDDCPDYSECCLCADLVGPKYVKLTIAGLADGTCDCDPVNGSYILSKSTSVCSGVGSYRRTCDTSEGLQEACPWGFQGVSACGINNNAEVSVILSREVADPTRYYLTVHYGWAITDPACSSEFYQIKWSSFLGVFATAPDCFTALDGVSLPFFCSQEQTGACFLGDCTPEDSTAFVEVP